MGQVWYLIVFIPDLCHLLLFVYVLKNCLIETFPSSTYQDMGFCVISKKKFDLFALIRRPGLEVIKLEFSLRLKIERNDWLIADTCPQAANHCALF